MEIRVKIPDDVANMVGEKLTERQIESLLSCFMLGLLLGAVEAGANIGGYEVLAREIGASIVPVVEIIS